MLIKCQRSGTDRVLQGRLLLHGVVNKIFTKELRCIGLGKIRGSHSKHKHSVCQNIAPCWREPSVGKVLMSKLKRFMVWPKYWIQVYIAQHSNLTLCYTEQQINFLWALFIHIRRNTSGVVTRWHESKPPDNEGDIKMPEIYKLVQKHTNL